MECLSIISDSAFRVENLGRQLHGLFETRLLALEDIPNSPPTQFTVCDVNLDSVHIPALKLWLTRKPKDAKIVLAVDKGSRFQAVQATAIGATDLLPRPLDAKALLKELLGDLESLAGPSSVATSPGVSAVVKALQSIFASASARLASNVPPSFDARYVRPRHERRSMRHADGVSCAISGSSSATASAPRRNSSSRPASRRRPAPRPG
jgi:hypothetical protein